MKTTMHSRIGRRLARAAPLLLAICWQTAMAEPTHRAAVEYFINQDPGVGNGTLVEVDSDRVSFTANFGPLPPGTHSLYLRVRSEEGLWGPALPYTFTVEPSSTFEKVAGWEASIDSPAAPGEGQRLAQPIASSNVASLTDTVMLDANMAIGNRTLYLRALDSGGTWGPALPFTFAHEPSGGTEIPIAIEYAWNPDLENPHWTRISLNDPPNAWRTFAFDAMNAALPLGTQVLAIRTIDSSGDVGLPILTPVAIVPASLTGHPPVADKLVVYAEGAGGIIPNSWVELPLNANLTPDSTRAVTLQLTGGTPGAAKVVAYVRSITGETGPHATTAFTLVVNGTNGYNAWRASGERFSPEEIANPAISGMQADPDQDGVTNDLEFAFGTHPREASNLMLPHTTLENGRLAFRFRQLQGGDGHRAFNYTANGIRYTVQYAYGLAGDWKEGADRTFDITDILNNGDGTDTVTVSPTNGITVGRDQLFLRLLVTYL